MKPIVGKIFQLQDQQIQQLTFERLSSFSDSITTRIFEGFKMNHDFSHKQLFNVLHSLKLNLINPFRIDKEISKMYASRFLQRTLMLMDQIVFKKQINKDLGLK